MDPAQEQLARLRQNPRDWAARAELARIWREHGVEFNAHQLLAGAVGAPHNRRELQQLLDAFGEPPRSAEWAPLLDEYLRWSPGCPLGLSALAHVVEESGKVDEAVALYERAINIDHSVEEPVLFCMREEPEPAAAPAPSSEGEKKTRHKLLEDQRFVSLMVAVGVHLFLIILLSFWVIYAPPIPIPRLVASNPTEEQANRPQNRPKKSATSPISNTNSMDLVSVPVLSDMAVSLKAPELTNSPGVFTGSDFSPSMSFGEIGGGNVSFFGSRGKTKNMVYVVDVSGSMQQQGEQGKTRIALLKQELKRSVSALPLSVKYQIIFFSNKAWFAGDEPPVTGFMAKGADDPENYPSRSLVRATQSQKRKTLAHIDEVKSGGGTNWRLPLKMAMKLEPDLIYFMTDGEIDSDSGKVPVIEDVVNYNREKGNARVNTICLMEMKAYEKLHELANRTRGTVFLVEEDGTVVRGIQLDRMRR